MFVKICGITNEDDALLAVAMGADAVGFVFAPSTRQIAPQQVYDITRRLPPEILTVGVFRDEHPSRVIEIVNRSGVRAAQLHGHETPDDVAAVMAQVRRVIKAFPAGSPDAARADRFGTDMILVDAATPGSGSLFDCAGRRGSRWAQADPGRWAHARQRRGRGAAGASVGCRRVHGGRAFAGQEGRVEGEGVYRTRPTGRAGAVCGAG